MSKIGTINLPCCKTCHQSDTTYTFDTEKNLIESFMQKNDSEHIDMEEAFYLEFLASINKKEVLHLHYVEKQSPFLIAETLKPHPLDD